MVLNKLFKRKKAKLKRYIKIEQRKDSIHIEGFLSNKDYQVKQIWFHSRDDEKGKTFDNMNEGNSFKFCIKLTPGNKLLKIDEGIYNLFLIVSVHENDLTEKKKINLNNKETTYFDESTRRYEYPIRLGRFQETESEKMESGIVEGKICKLYKTVKGNLSLAINKAVQQEAKTQIDYLKSKRHEIHFGGKLYTRSFKVQEIKLLIIGRESNIETRLPLTSLSHLEKETRKKFGLNRYRYEAELNLNKLFQNKLLGADVYDLFFEINYEDSDELVQVRIGKPRFRARYKLKSAASSGDNKIYAASPYYTFRHFNLSLQVDDFESEVYQYLRKMMRWSVVYRLFNKSKKVWIVGERPNKGQDTGYHFFKHVRENYPDKNIYYVIDEHSPELKNVSPFGNVILFNSKEHIKHILIAERIIGSHHPDYLFPLRTKEFAKKVKAKKVFLQHGVMGTKNMVANYGKNAPGFSTDLFLVSSQFEREMIVNDFNYDPNEVVITGLSRFDSLFKNDIAIKRQLLIIPTWREWLVRDDVFLESEYYQTYRSLVYNKDLHDLAKKYNFDIVFCLHPNMQKFSHYFKDAPVRIIYQGEIDVQFLLKQSAMMITDYSSVAFDFSFLNKPIIYFQFDRDRFIGKRGSHLDLNNELPGDIVFDISEIIPITKQYAQSNFKMKQENKVKASKFIKYKDLNSSERIYRAIENKVRKKPIYKKIEETEIYRTLFNLFRKSDYYFPTMKLFYNFARTFLPVDRNLILFESGIGKQYADSPRYIYEEIVKNRLDYKKVWVCSQNIRFKDLENTTRIRRLSPSYYYYLARAKYWVNNQNFPTYIKKRKQTVYLQTWHGTPLKKMLHDLQTVMGRTDGYIERVSKAIESWDYLISPSEYATKAFKSAFKYGGEILEVGYPRNDIFYKKEADQLSKTVKSRLNISPGKKVILYAPTFRDNQITRKNKFKFDIEMDLQKMKEELGDKYIILLRMHVVVTNKIQLEEDLSDFVIDVSNYSDMQELLVITDVLITDYSSVMFDFANTKKPMLFYTYDLESYRDNIRGFYMDFENEAPGPFVKTTDEIISNIKNSRNIERKYVAKYSQFYNNYCSLEDGKASERVVNILFDKQINRN